jgi:hypothetical protein
MQSFTQHVILSPSLPLRTGSAKGPEFAEPTLSAREEHPQGDN